MANQLAFDAGVAKNCVEELDAPQNVQSLVVTVLAILSVFLR